MTMRVRSIARLALGLALLGALLGAALAAPPVRAAGALAWRLETPPPPEAARSPAPIGLGRIGDIEFWAPNRGLLITAGNGSTIPPGLWAYNGKRWHELSIVCGATDGRIAWAAPEEFWTISDGRPGQAAGPLGELPELEDDTLCRFSGGSVVESFATPAFEKDSYLPMHAAACITPSDCWFAGEALPEPFAPGAFHLHWNGSTMTAEQSLQGHPVWDMRLFDGALYESVLWSPSDRFPVPNPEISKGPSLLHRIEPEAGVETNGGSPFAVIYDYELPLDQPVAALDYLHLSADQEALWAAAGTRPGGGGQVTVLRYSEGAWEQVLGAEAPSSGEAIPTGDVVTAIAAEPGTDSAWIALDSQQDLEDPSPSTSALVAHVYADGTVSEVQSLPAPGEEEGGQPVGPKGAGAKLACPAPHDCWLATTQGWLYHLAPEGETELAEDTDPAFAHLITVRPPDGATPQVPSVTIPIDDSGLPGEAPPEVTEFPTVQKEPVGRVAVPLLTELRSRLVHKSTLELRFHLAVRARVRLLAKRDKRVIASTPTRILAAGERKLLLALNVHRWPTALDLQTHALAPLPTVSQAAPSVTTVTTSLAFPDRRGSLGLGLLP